MVCRNRDRYCYNALGRLAFVHHSGRVWCTCVCARNQNQGQRRIARRAAYNKKENKDEKETESHILCLVLCEERER